MKMDKAKAMHRVGILLGAIVEDHSGPWKSKRYGQNALTAEVRLSGSGRLALRMVGDHEANTLLSGESSFSSVLLPLRGNFLMFTNIFMNFICTNIA